MSTQSICRALVAPAARPFSLAARFPIRQFSAFSPVHAPKNLSKGKQTKEKQKKRKKKHPRYKQHNLNDIEQFTLCDAIRYIKAFEVGRQPTEPKYDVAVKLSTNKDGPVLRNQMRLPHAVKTDIKIAVICPPNSADAKAAKAAGATLVGEDEIFERIKSGVIDFDRCIAHPDSLPKMTKAGMPRILGPRGLMPSVKMGTVVEKIGPAIQGMLGASMYRERQGVIRMAVGQLGFTPEQLRDNVKAFISQVKLEAARLSEQSPKSIHEVVLSSTHSPGFSLNGEFKSEHSPNPRILSAV